MDRDVRYTNWLNGFSNAFPALQNRNYLFYFFGQLVSLIGTWLQIVAQGWLVLQLTNSAFIIGLIAALSTLPSLFFTLFGGVIVDQFPKRRILLFTQFFSMVLAFVLGGLTLSGMITVAHIGVISFCLGLITAIDSPARQSFVPELVSKEQLPSAIALNSGVFNAARVIGPSFAGFLIAIVGTGGAFIINAFSYTAVIGALMCMKLVVREKSKSKNPFKAIQEGVLYTINHPVIRILLLFTGVSSIFGWSYTTVLPIIAQNKLGLGATGLGYLYAASGFGAVTAAIMIATYSRKLNPIVFISGGNAIFAISITCFTYSDQIQIAMPLLFFAGFGLLSQFATMNTIIQSMVKNEFRGRVMSIYILMFLGMTPIGNFLVGLLSETFDTGFAIRLGAIIVFLFGMGVFFLRKKVIHSYAIYKAN